MTASRVGSAGLRFAPQLVARSASQLSGFASAHAAPGGDAPNNTPDPKKLSDEDCAKLRQMANTMKQQMQDNRDSMSALNGRYTRATVVAGFGVAAYGLINGGLVVATGSGAAAVAARAPFINGTSAALGSRTAFQLAASDSRAAFWGGIVTSSSATVVDHLSPALPTPGGAVQSLFNDAAFQMQENADLASQAFATQNRQILGDYGDTLAAYNAGGCK